MDYYAASKWAGQANRYPNFDPATDCRLPDEHEPFEYIEACNAYGQAWYIDCGVVETDLGLAMECELECLDAFLPPQPLTEPEPGELAESQTWLRWNTETIEPPETRETMPLIQSLPSADRLIEVSVGVLYSYQAIELSALAVFAVVAIGQRWGWWR